MVRPIVRDEALLRVPSREAGVFDIPAADDLMDTLKANAAFCVGMAANMIGVSAAIIAFRNGNAYSEMFNPRIVACQEPYDAMEGCLSLPGERPAKRFRRITVEWQTRAFERKRAVFTGFPAQIIQHEIDHIHGILI